jgi:hypothetical protein
MAGLNDPNKIAAELGVGGSNNSVAGPNITGYNPRITFEETTEAPYKKIIHEYFNGKHLITEILLDGYQGNVTEIGAQYDADNPPA